MHRGQRKSGGSRKSVQFVWVVRVCMHTPTALSSPGVKSKFSDELLKEVPPTA